MNQTQRNYLLTKLRTIKNKKIELVGKDYPEIDRKDFFTKKNLKKDFADKIIAEAQDMGNYNNLSIPVKDVFDLKIYNSLVEKRLLNNHKRKNMITAECLKLEELIILGKDQNEFTKLLSDFETALY